MTDNMAALDALLGTGDPERMEYLANGKANIMQGLGVSAIEAERLMVEQGYMTLDECNPAVRAQLAERRAVVADLVRERADQWNCDEREAQYRLAVAGELGQGDVPRDVWQRVLDQAIGPQNYG